MVFLGIMIFLQLEFHGLSRCRCGEPREGALNMRGSRHSSAVHAWAASARYKRK
jgi:hypothetical protein